MPDGKETKKGLGWTWPWETQKWLPPAFPREPSQQESWLTPRTRAIMGTPQYAEAETTRLAAEAEAGPQQEVDAIIAAITGQKRPTPTAPGGIPRKKRVGTITEGGWIYQVGYDENGEEEYRIPLGRAEAEPSAFEKARTQEVQSGLQRPKYIFETYEEAVVAAPEGFRPIPVTSGQWAGSWTYERVSEVSPTTQAAEALQREKFAWEQQQAGEEAKRQQEVEKGRLALQQQKFAWEQTQAGEEAKRQQQQFQWSQEVEKGRLAEQEKRYRAQLASQPKSWLEYAAYTGEAPRIQPWMLPLMPQQYAGAIPGEAIQGWTGGSMAGMPGLKQPSPQYWARMGPQAQQQFMGYQQGQQGIRQEETEFRLAAQAPPGGRYAPLTWAR